MSILLQKVAYFTREKVYSKSQLLFTIWELQKNNSQKLRIYQFVALLRCFLFDLYCTAVMVSFYLMGIIFCIKFLIGYVKKDNIQNMTIYI